MCKKENSFLLSLLGYVSLGALGDSFYEYLIKAFLVTSKEDTQAQEMFYDALKVWLLTCLSVT